MKKSLPQTLLGSRLMSRVTQSATVCLKCLSQGLLVPCAEMIIICVPSTWFKLKLYHNLPRNNQAVKLWKPVWCLNLVKNIYIISARFTPLMLHNNWSLKCPKQKYSTWKKRKRVMWSQMVPTCVHSLVLHVQQWSVCFKTETNKKWSDHAM